MTDWSRDPVFGDVALRLAPRCDKNPWEGDLGPPVDPLVRVWAVWGRLTEQERRELSEARPWSAVPGRGGPDMVWFEDRERLAELACDRPHISALMAAIRNVGKEPAQARTMGVVNVTPDSFSDGGAFLDPARAAEHGLALVAEGADLLDVGGESTRPGSSAVAEADELERVLPVIQRLARETRVPISIDTTKSSVAEAALASGASIVNDVSAGRFDPRILGVTARAGAGYVAMHMQGAPRDMQEEPRYENVVMEVHEFLRARCRAALDAGIARSRLWVDPGLGFGKTLDHNRRLLLDLHELRSLGLPVLVGPSRKSFIAAIEAEAGQPRSAPADRLGGTLAAVTVAVQRGAEILRVHDVRAARQAALVARALAR